MKSKPLVSDLNADVRTPAQQLRPCTKSSALSAYRTEINFLNPMILGCLIYPVIKNYAIVTICATMSGVSMIVCASRGRKKRKEGKKKIRRYLTALLAGNLLSRFQAVVLRLVGTPDD